MITHEKSKYALPIDWVAQGFDLMYLLVSFGLMCLLSIFKMIRVFYQTCSVA